MSKKPKRSSKIIRLMKRGAAIIGSVLLTFIGLGMHIDRQVEMNSNHTDTSAYKYVAPAIHIPKNNTLKYSDALGVPDDNGGFFSSYWNIKYTPQNAWESTQVKEIGKLNSELDELINDAELEGSSGCELFGGLSTASDPLYIKYRFDTLAYNASGQLEGGIFGQIWARDSYADKSSEDFVMDLYGSEEMIQQSDKVSIAGNDYLHISVIEDSDSGGYEQYITKKDNVFFVITVFAEPGCEYFINEALSCFELYESSSSLDD